MLSRRRHRSALRRPAPGACPASRRSALRLEPLEDRVLPSISPHSLAVEISGEVTDGNVGLPGWTLRLFDQGHNFVVDATTDVDGDYDFANLPPGS